jgi:hypothetical protein
VFAVIPAPEIATLDADVTTPAPSNVTDAIDVVLPTVLLVTLLATAIILGVTRVKATLYSLY